MKFYVANTDGKILQIGECPDGSDVSHITGATEYVGDIDPTTHYLDGEVLASFPARPSEHYTWDWVTKAWVPDLVSAILTKVAEVKRQGSELTYQPIAYSGFNFDADAVSRERISGTSFRISRGDGLPVGWLGWRDADNGMRWATDTDVVVKAHLDAIAKLIEDREQSILVQGWNHAAAISVLGSVEAVAAYPITWI